MQAVSSCDCPQNTTSRVEARGGWWVLKAGVVLGLSAVFATDAEVTRGRQKCNDICNCHMWRDTADLGVTTSVRTVRSQRPQDPVGSAASAIV